MKTKLTTTILLIIIATAACGPSATPVPTEDVNAISTAAVATAMGQLSAQFTQTALAAPTSTSAPTNTALPLATSAISTANGTAPTTVGGLPTVSFNTTPIAGFTPLPTSAVPSGPTASLGDACNNSQFLADITIPDGTVMKPGENFQKVWAIKNTGTCTWDEGYALVYIGGSNPDLDPYDFRFRKNDDFVSSGETINLGLNLTTPCQPGKYQGTWRMRNDQGFYFGTYLSVYIEVKDNC